jgi:2-polyprenyl-6-methoxyphenol hydroxylase-like FAD-dependent oxidoreductase
VLLTVGQGLSNAFHDVRMVSDIILAGRPWPAAAFASYAQERRERSRRQQIIAALFARTQVEFDDAARARRQRLQSAAGRDPQTALPLQAPLVGAHVLPQDVYREARWRPLLE